MSEPISKAWVDHYGTPTDPPDQSIAHEVLDDLRRENRELRKHLTWSLGEIDRLTTGRDGSEATLRRYGAAQRALNPPETQ